jgi:hypothetical protein
VGHEGGPLCIVEFDDYARFAEYWLQTGSGMPADLYEDDIVDEHDLRRFARNGCTIVRTTGRSDDISTIIKGDMAGIGVFRVLV